jgi:predicted TIM-barrel fold metal-dependent hydrolase
VGFHASVNSAAGERQCVGQAWRESEIRIRWRVEQHDRVGAFHGPEDDVHVQINMTADQIAAAETLWNRLPSPIVFDHIGHSPAPSHPAYAVMRRLIDKSRTWVKLSVTYDNTTDGPPGYADVIRLGQALVKAAPERLVWGSNWPHPNETQKPDDAVLFDLMAQWAPDDATRHRILVQNPATLYDFRDA